MNERNSSKLAGIDQQMVNNWALNTEQQIIERCQEGDPQAQFALYKRYAKSMLNTAYRLTNHREDAKDVLQEAFIKAFSKLDQFRENASFDAWLRRIVINTALNLLKKRGQQRSLTFEALENRIAHEAPRDYSEVEFNIALAQKALMQLPNGYRTVLSLYLLEGYDHREIAEILNISVSTSLTQYARGKQKLIEIIRKMKQNGLD